MADPTHRRISHSDDTQDLSPEPSSVPGEDSQTETRSLGGESEPDLKLPAAPQNRSIGRYRLDRRLGQGSFGEVWLGYDPRLCREVAVKLPRAGSIRLIGGTDYFLGEARRLAALKIAGIVPVYDADTINGQTFIVSEFVEGGTLAEALQAGQLSQRAMLRLLVKASEILDQAHESGIIHRDVKPANILLTREGHPVIADFGLAVTREELLHKPGSKAGTFVYMAPESLRGDTEHIDRRADVFSLGIILVEMLTGERPFTLTQGDGPETHLEHREVRPAAELFARIPKRFRRICQRALAENPENRYPTAREFARELREAIIWQAPLWLFGLGGIGIIGLLAGLTLGLAQLTLPNAELPSPPTPPAPMVPEPIDPLVAWGEPFGVGPLSLPVPGLEVPESLGIDPERQAINLTSRGHTFAQLGTLEGEAVKLSVTLDRTTWNLGSCGLFFGYGPNPAGGPSEVAYHEVGLTIQKVEGQGEFLHVTRVYGYLDPNSIYLNPRRTMGEARFPYPTTPKRLEVEIDAQGIHAVRFDGQEIPEMSLDFHNQRSPKGSYLGPWGVSNHQGTTWVSEPSITPLSVPEEP